MAIHPPSMPTCQGVLNINDRSWAWITTYWCTTCCTGIAIVSSPGNSDMNIPNQRHGVRRNATCKALCRVQVTRCLWLPIQRHTTPHPSLKKKRKAFTDPKICGLKWAWCKQKKKKKDMRCTNALSSLVIALCATCQPLKAALKIFNVSYIFSWCNYFRQFMRCWSTEKKHLHMHKFCS